MAKCLVTGGAGFIGSNLVGALLSAGHNVRVLDDFSTGHQRNLDGFLPDVEVVTGSICDRDVVFSAMHGIAYCFHLAAVPSVPRSVQDPLRSHEANVTGSLHVFLAARETGVQRVVYASSSSVYGRASVLPLQETLPRAPISPYGASKAAVEMYAESFSKVYGQDLVGLRYFNVFGPRQDPKSAYAAVIPLFIRKMLSGEAPPIHGDGMQSRDFTYVENVVSANLKAMDAPGPKAGVYNIACGATVSIRALCDILNSLLGTALAPVFEHARAGDIRDSLADISRAATAFGYAPAVPLREGLTRTIAWLKNEEAPQ